MKNLPQIIALFLATVAVIVALISLMLNVLLLSELDQARNLAINSLQEAGQQTAALATQRIEYRFALDQTVPVRADIPLNHSLPVQVQFEVNQTVPFETSVTVNQTLQVPIRTELPLNTIATVPLSLGGGETQIINIPIEASLPLDVLLEVPLNIQIPVQAEIPLRLPVDEQVQISINQVIPVDTSVPLQLEVPLNLAISDTPFGNYLQSLGQGLLNLAQSLQE